MLAFESMLVDAAEQAGIKCPPNEQLDEEWDAEAFPHFRVFCSTQLCRPMSDWTQHWDNAKVIAAIPESEIRQVTLEDLIKKGFRL